MKRLFLFLLLTLSYYISAQNYPNLLNANKVSTIAYFTNGAKVQYRIREESIKYKTNSDKILNSSTSNYYLDLKVVDSTENSFTFEAKYQNETHEDQDPQLEEVLNQLQFGCVIRYKTDELGIFDTILNLPELKTELLANLNKSKELISKVTNESLSITYSLIIENLIHQFDSLDNVEALFLSDLIAIHSIYGFEIQMGKPIDLDVIYPTVGDVSLYGKGKLTAQSINKQKDETRLVITTKPNHEELQEYLGFLLLLFELEGTKRIKFDEANVKMNTKTNYLMRLSDGWMTKIEVKSQTEVLDKKRKSKRVVNKTYELQF